MELHVKNHLKDALDAHRKGDFTHARKLYEELLIASPDHPQILYNVALLFIATDETQKAIATLEKVLDSDPGHADALNNLGALLLKMDQHEQALQCFSTLIATHPDHLEGRNNLAATLLQLERYFHAAQHYQLLLEKTPDDVSARYSYGVALLESDDFQEAIHQFEKVLAEKPNHLNAQSNIGIAHLKKGHTDKARQIFQKILTENPDRPEIAYLYSALTGDNVPDKPPADYIQNLFNQYAGHYESHMVDTLKYETPQKLRVLLENHFQIKNLKILDLGCGTGLSGFAFKDCAAVLNGVDLSHKMLNIAKKKNIYSKLAEEDLMDYLKNNTVLYDLLLAADTFNYFGDLNELFEACYKNLDKNGLLLFSLEAKETASNWELQKNARYTHSKKYIEQIAKIHHFETLALEKSTLRRQNHEPVIGFLCLLQRV